MTVGLLIHIDTEDTIDVTTHEWGHGKDFRQGGCSFNTRRSEKSDFVKLLNSLGSYYLITYLKDSAYEPNFSDGGHPDDNATEAFASIFMIATRHLAELQNNIKSINAEAKAIIEQLVTIVATPQGGP